MSVSIASLVSKLQLDHWREIVGFSPEIEVAHKKLFSPNISETETVQILGSWLQKYQPCLFGRIAAKLGLISYFILTESFLMESD